MEIDDYPALYQSADLAARRSQSSHLNLLRCHFLLLIAGAGLGAYGVQNKISAIFAAVVFIGAVSLSIFMAVRQYEKTWYRSRAVAESVKTSTWRFMMRSEPYQEEGTSTQKAKVDFRNLLHKILAEHCDLAQEFCGEISTLEQITEKMMEIRALPLNERIQFYQSKRIDEQRDWYARKSNNNRWCWILWFCILVLLQSTAVTLTLIRIAFPEWNYWSLQVVVVAAGCVLTWLQVKRFREISAAYALTAHEIGIIKTELQDIKSEEYFSKFVGDAENAFSREHTQWVARKDHRS